MTKIEAVGNKDKLQEKAAQQNWEGPTKTKGEAKQEAVFSTPPTTTSTATVKNQPAAFSLPPQSKPIDARGPSVKPDTESTLNPNLNASKPSSIPPVAQKTETYAEVAASKPKPSQTISTPPDEHFGSQKYTQDRMIGSVDMRPDDGWSGVKNIIVEDAKEIIKAPTEFVSSAIHTTQEKTKELGEKVKEFVTPSTETTSKSTSSSSSLDNPRALEAVDRTSSIAFSPSIGLATTNTESYAKDSVASARATSNPAFNRGEEMWRGAAESTGRDFGPIPHGQGAVKETVQWAKDKAREDVDWAKDKARSAEYKAVEGARQAKNEVENKASGLAQRAKDDVEWAKDKVKEDVEWAKDKAKEDANWAKDKVKDDANWAKGKVGQNVEWAKDKARENVDWAKAKTQEAEDRAKSDWGAAKDKAKEATWSAAHTAKDNIDWAKEKTAEAGWKAQSSDNIEWAKDKAGRAVETAKDKALSAAQTIKEDISWGAEKAKEKTKDLANKTYEGAKYEADVVRDSTGRFIEREKSALKEDARLVKDKAAAVGGGAISALESATDVVLREARDFGKAVVNTAEDVKEGLLESKDELKQAASEKTQEWKDKAEDLKRTAADKTQEFKDKATTSIQHGKEKVQETFSSGSGDSSSSWGGPAEAAKQHGGEVRDKTRVFAEASGSDGGSSLLKEGDVRQAIDQSKKVEEERHEGILSSMIHWMFRGGEPSSTTTTTTTTTETYSPSSSAYNEAEFNKRLERINSVAYSPAIGSTLDVAPLEVSAKELAAPHATSLPVITDTRISSSSTALFEESPVNKTSASSSYFQPYSTEIEKKEVEERVLEQTIDFFY